MPKKTTSPKSINTEITEPTVEELQLERSMLEKQVDDLKKAVYRLQLERDVLEKAAEILKKDKGINLATLRNSAKADIIGALRKDIG